MSNATYQEMPCISSHWLKDMLDSPAECYRKHLDPQRQVQESTKAMQFGTLIHCLTLTPLQFSEEFIIESRHGRNQAKKARYAALAATGKIIITPDEFDRAQAIVTAMKADPEARQLLTGGKKEQTIIQERGPGLLPLKARIDLHHPDQRRVIELKTSYDLDKIKTTMQRYRYPLSAAFYRELAQALTVVFIFVQTREPFNVAVFELSPLALQEGREQFTTALHRFDECWLKNEWPEAEPVAPDLDDDPLMMNFIPLNPNRQRYDLPVGELAL
ncbi:MAG: PD-(D/E)XK nuclease-like domain-containing protein [Candidatus Contendobacter sp.]|nr:PD-(D/E)XK nuclease-like domain-containing protein [Candidatus Contendobacter sp.]